MARIPDVSTFNAFNDLDPQDQNQCIYITQRGARCKWRCSDNSQAIKLHTAIIKQSGRNVELDLLKKYILSNCCTSGRAQHRDRIEDVGLLIPLAYRWQSEIRRQDADRLEPVPVVPIKHTPTFETPLSEFRPHIAQPTLTDSVSKKLQDTLVGRDFETGSLYIFDRASSAGHVKIGWTAKSVGERLENWSKCGYHPNLLFSVKNVPFAQRVETLAHYELVKEWRRERMCKAKWCQKSHSEWFEISPERAAQVLGDWVTFIKLARPYDPRYSWSLNPYWRKIVKQMDEKEEPITGRSLLVQHQIRELKNPVCVKIRVDSRRVIKSEDQETVHFKSKEQDQDQENLKNPRMYMRPVSIAQGPIPMEKPFTAGQSLPQSVSSFETRLLAGPKRTKDHAFPKVELCSRINSAFVEDILPATPEEMEKKQSPVKTFIKDEPAIKVEDVDDKDSLNENQANGLADICSNPSQLFVDVHMKGSAQDPKKTPLNTI